MLAIVLGIVVLGGLALWFGVLPGAQPEVNDHLDQLTHVVAATRPDGASVVRSFRNDVCAAGVERVGSTFRTELASAEIQQHAQRTLRRTGWKVSEAHLDRDHGQRKLSASHRFSWGRAVLTIAPGARASEIDVTAGFNC
jgi:hypothetical protein